MRWATPLDTARPRRVNPAIPHIYDTIPVPSQGTNYKSTVAVDCAKYTTSLLPEPIRKIMELFFRLLKMQFDHPLEQVLLPSLPSFTLCPEFTYKMSEIAINQFDPTGV